MRGREAHRRAKTDRIDAALIAACTHVSGERDEVAPDRRFEALGDHLTFVEQVEDDIARFKTRSGHESGVCVRFVGT